MTTTSARSKATDRPRSWKRGRCSNCVPQYSADRIKETNPCRIDLLWRQAMAPKVSKRLPSNAPSCSRATRSSGLGEEVQSNRSTLPSQDAATNEIQTSPSVTQVSTTRTSKSESDKNATARDVDFEDTQLIDRDTESNGSKCGLFGRSPRLSTPRYLRTQLNHASFTEASFRRFLLEVLNGI